MKLQRWDRVVATTVRALALALCAAPVAAQQSMASAPEIQSVVFEGATSLDEDVLAAAIVTQASACRSPLFFVACLVGDFDWAETRRLLRDTAEVTQDARRLEALYRLWGHPEAVVRAEVEPEPDGDVVVRFHIAEGRPTLVRSLSIRGLSGVTPPLRLADGLPLRIGDPYALPRLDALLDLIELRLAERGHPYAEIEVSGEVDEPGGTADLVLEVVPGPAAVFGRIEVAAEPPIDAEVVRRRVAFASGERFHPSAIQRTERGLYGLPIVERVATELTGLIAGDTVIDVRVAVDARRRAGVDVEGTMSTTDCLEVAAFWRHRYLGGPRALSVGGGFSNLLAEQAGGGFPCSSTGVGEFAEPNHMLEAELREYGWLGDPALTLVLGGFTRRESSPNAFVAHGFGATVQLARELGAGWWAIAGWHPKREEVTAAGAYFCGNYGVCSEEGGASLSGPSWLAPVELVVAWSSTERPGGVRRPDTGPGTPWRLDVVPSWRWSVRLGAEAAGEATGSDYSFRRAIAEASATRVLGRSIELAARVRGGAVHGTAVLPPQLRLYSGGVATVRGVEENLLGPKVLVGRSGAPLPVCDPASSLPCTDELIDPSFVTVRPSGGDRLAEASLEARYWVSDVMQVAAFVDGGRLWRESGAPFDADRAQSRITPGVGVRLVTDLGPIRVDVGYDGAGEERLPLLVVDEEGGIAHAGSTRFSPYEYGSPGGFREFVRRLQLHVGIGQAF